MAIRQLVADALCSVKQNGHLSNLALLGAVTTQIRQTNHIFTTQTITDGKKKRKNRQLRGNS